MISLLKVTSSGVFGVDCLSPPQAVEYTYQQSKNQIMTRQIRIKRLKT
jgi:hypothetical protein